MTPVRHLATVPFNGISLKIKNVIYYLPTHSQAVQQNLLDILDEVGLPGV